MAEEARGESRFPPLLAAYDLTTHIYVRMRSLSLSLSLSLYRYLSFSFRTPPRRPRFHRYEHGRRSPTILENGQNGRFWNAHAYSRCVVRIFEYAARDRSPVDRRSRGRLCTSTALFHDFPRDDAGKERAKAENVRTYVRLAAAEALKVGRPIDEAASGVARCGPYVFKPVCPATMYIFDSRFPITSNYLAATCYLPRWRASNWSR